MQVGVPKEIKDHEHRVGLTPGSVKELTARGHEVLVQRDAASGIGYLDEHYRSAGARIVDSAEDVYAEADLIVKVKEIVKAEYGLLRKGQLLFCYLHLAADHAQTETLLRSGVSAIAYETVTANDGTLPLLMPMSEVAGRISVQMGAMGLQKNNGGRGVLIGGVPGVAPARVAIVGGGTAGANAATIALGMEADVTILDRAVGRLRTLRERFGPSLRTVMANAETVAEYVSRADLVIGAVLVPGASAPKIITRDMVRAMRNGSALVDLSIDQGGCAETSRITTHDEPFYVDEGVVHYCVSNMPTLVAQTATKALNNATLPFVISLANKGLAALDADPHLANGINVHAGEVVHEAVAESLGTPLGKYRPGKS
jgi:alanine dehydrogenase